MLRNRGKKPSFQEKKLGFSLQFTLSFYMNHGGYDIESMPTTLLAQ